MKILSLLDANILFVFAFTAMTSQIPLGLTTLLSYSPRNFVVHDGVAQIVSLLSNRQTGKVQQYFSCFISSPPRMGKTHLSIYLSELLAGDTYVVRLIDARDLPQAAESLIRKKVTMNRVVIIDDLHLIAEQLAQIEGDSSLSGSFVAMVEHLRATQGTLVCLSSLPIDAYHRNPHVHSRLVEGERCVLKFPSDSFFISVVDHMLIQRGISLPRRSVTYLSKVLPRDFSQIENYIANLDYLSNILGEDISLRTVKDAV